ncbi:MAG: RluA family pseudouridine synthase [Chitinispirillales bacterium]|jgi:23S rRNA pseudouridine1911/1915/1917 synthase|nr:RluA family pseudouridine synthase [Chitinispirillales bacterium]
MDYIVNNDRNGRRLDVFLADAVGGSSRSCIQKIIADGRVSVNGKPVVKKNADVVTGDVVAVDDRALTQARPYCDIAPLPQDIPLNILYEDNHIAVINKPSGLVVHPGRGNADGTVVNALLHRFGANVSSGSEGYRPGIVHRLDKDTSGALIVAKTDAAHTAFAELFMSRAINKVYTGFCVGARPLEHGVIDLPLAASRRERVKRIVDEHNGKPAVTEYRLKKFICGIALMEFTLHTGRTHQIRVHCGHKGFPIVGDDLYGGTREAALKIPPMERPFAYSVFKRFERHALHALSLSFTHPLTGENVQVTAPYPEDFCGALTMFERVCP